MYYMRSGVPKKLWKANMEERKYMMTLMGMARWLWWHVPRHWWYMVTNKWYRQAQKIDLSFLDEEIKNEKRTRILGQSKN